MRALLVVYPSAASPNAIGRDAAWVKNPIDRFILARLEREGLHPSPEAEKRLVIRRVSLDLTGLPPTPAEVQAFLADSSANAYETVVDRLLASPRYGERMAFRWMEVARYGDSNGYQTDGARDMWRWRDWVIDSFTRNMPYDRFTVEQLAGDLLANATLDQRIASGFNRNHRTTGEGGIIPEEYRVEYVADRAQTTAIVWLGSPSDARAATITSTTPSRKRISIACSRTSIRCPTSTASSGTTVPKSFCEGPTARSAEKTAELDAGWNHAVARTKLFNRNCASRKRIGKP